MNLYFRICAVALCIIAGVGSWYFYPSKGLNPVEEVAEEVIKDVSGFDIDLEEDHYEKKQLAHLDTEDMVLTSASSCDNEAGHRR